MLRLSNADTSSKPKTVLCVNATTQTARPIGGFESPGPYSTTCCRRRAQRPNVLHRIRIVRSTPRRTPHARTYDGVDDCVQILFDDTPCSPKFVFSDATPPPPPPPPPWCTHIIHACSRVTLVLIAIHCNVDRDVSVRIGLGGTRLWALGLMIYNDDVGWESNN